MPYRYLERGLGLLGGGSQYTPRRRNMPCRCLERRLDLLGGGDVDLLVGLAGRTCWLDLLVSVYCVGLIKSVVGRKTNPIAGATLSTESVEGVPSAIGLKI